MMPDTIVLATLNARYSHASIGLRYLYANLKELQAQARLLEFTIKDQPAQIVEKLLQRQPRIIGLGVYIWNALETQQVLHLIKKVAPETVVIVGGPEVSYFPQRVSFEQADYLVQGEGDWAFYRLCRAILDGQAPPERLQPGLPEDLNSLAFPYPYYSEHDLKQRIAYVEASRGCPFTCEFCLSSLDQKVRKFETSAFLEQLEQMWQRGARNFKFIDRTFNLNPSVTNQILDFFLNKQQQLPAQERYFVHFEMIPDHFPQHLKDKLQQFAPTTLQLEIGIQTLNPEVSARIRRKLKPEVVRDNLIFLAEHTHAHLHVDLIVGLPGESLQSFGANLNALVSWINSEIQIGILKKLAGTDLQRHDQTFGMVYSDSPPYDILQNDLISFAEMQAIKRFARYWDLTYNSGNFKQSLRLLWPDGDVYSHFAAFSSWLYAQTQSTSQIALARLAELLFNYLTTQQGLPPEQVGPLMQQDLAATQGRHCPPFLRPYQPSTALAQADLTGPKAIKRQLKHASHLPVASDI